MKIIYMYTILQKVKYMYKYRHPKITPNINTHCSITIVRQINVLTAQSYRFWAIRSFWVTQLCRPRWPIRWSNFSPIVCALTSLEHRLQHIQSSLYLLVIQKSYGEIQMSLKWRFRGHLGLNIEKSWKSNEIHKSLSLGL